MPGTHSSPTPKLPALPLLTPVIPPEIVFFTPVYGQLFPTLNPSHCPVPSGVFFLNIPFTFLL